MKFFEKIRYNLNLTQNEIRIITFLTITLLIGATIKLIKSNSKETNLLFDYSKTDSIFFSSSNNITPTVTTQDDKIESKNFRLKEKSININKASKSELMKLPGIGEVLAENIIKYREDNGKIDDISELLKVKGIGKKKLDKIKPYIFIE